MKRLHKELMFCRIFDSLNWIPQMEKSIQAVRDAGKIAEAAICYTG